MMLTFLQIAAIVGVGLYLFRWRAEVRRRSSQSWESLIARLRTDWSARELSDQFLWKEELNATPENAWQRMEGPKGLCAMHQNAKVMLEMADFAFRNSDEEQVDRVVLETLRSDAMQIRILVVTALAQYAFAEVGEGARISAYRAAALYTGMAARTTQLLQEHAAIVIPDFVAAM